MHPLIENKKDIISELCIQYHVSKLFAFGSITNGNFTEDSDIDFLYEFDLESFAWREADYDYIDNLNDFEKTMSDLFHRKIDLVRNADFNNHTFKNIVTNTKQLIYAQ